MYPPPPPPPALRDVINGWPLCKNLCSGVVYKFACVACAMLSIMIKLNDTLKWDLLSIWDYLHSLVNESKPVIYLQLSRIIYSFAYTLLHSTILVFWPTLRTILYLKLRRVYLLWETALFSINTLLLCRCFYIIRNCIVLYTHVVFTSHLAFIDNG